MSTTVREFIKRKLSPRAIERTRYFKWISNFYLAHSVASVFIRRTPEVLGFPRGVDLGFARSGIRNIAGLR
jgi:hypothetical protein